MPIFYYLSPADDCTVATLIEPEEIEFIDELMNYDTDKSVTFRLNGNATEGVLANNLGWPIVSARIKKIIETLLQNNEKVIWYKVKVLSLKEEHIFYVPYFIKEDDVLDFENSIFAARGFVVKACISAKKTNGLQIFPVPSSDSRIIISKSIYNAIIQAGIDINHFETVAITS